MYKIISNHTQRLAAVVKKIIFFTVFVTITDFAIAQPNPTVKISESRPTVMQVMKSIENQTELKFTYDGDFDLTRRVTLPTAPTQLSVILSRMLEGTNRDYSISGKFILIKQPRQKTAPRRRVAAPVTENVVSQSIHGKVTLSDGEGVYNAIVMATERSAGTPKRYSASTDNNGNFTLGMVPEGIYILSVSHADYGVAEKLLEVTTTALAPVRLILNPDRGQSEGQLVTPGEYVDEQPLPFAAILAGATPGTRFVTPRWAIKTNLLHDLTTTINLGVEVRVSKMWTLDVPVSLNPWTFSDNKKIKNFIVHPEMRRWVNEPFNGHFIGVNAMCMYYNAGGVDLPLVMLDHLKETRYEGNAWGAGFTYGYQWMLSHRLSMEASLGVGYAYINYKSFDCGDCGFWKAEGSKHYFGVTKLGLSLIYILR